MTMYGSPPANLGLIDLSPDEMMFWLYCPISLAGKDDVILPPNLEWTWPIVSAVLSDLGDARGVGDNIYITAKTLHVTPENMGNRPGWHSDGFGTGDLNYIWQDRFPTEFMEPDAPFALPDDHTASMQAMCEQENYDVATYSVKHLLRLDQTVIHRVPVVTESGMRSFVKVSVSPDRYALRGNSVNHGLRYDWRLVDRQEDRNHPQTTSSPDTEPDRYRSPGL